jgi:hypothetical protein
MRCDTDFTWGSVILYYSPRNIFTREHTAIHFHKEDYPQIKARK